MDIRTQQRFGCYYTEPAISNLLVEQISFNTPDLVLELGAGGGSLIAAAAQRWKNAYFLTTDIDRSICLE